MASSAKLWITDLTLSDSCSGVKIGELASKIEVFSQNHSRFMRERYCPQGMVNVFQYWRGSLWDLGLSMVTHLDGFWSPHDNHLAMINGKGGYEHFGL